jgi:hypothetical protein
MVLRARSSEDRATAFEAVGRGFESLRARQTKQDKGFSVSAAPEKPEKADAHPETGFQAALEAFPSDLPCQKGPKKQMLARKRAFRLA